MLISARHPDLSTESTYLSADVAAAASSSTVDNTKGFATNDLVVFGNLGEELSEIVTLTSVTVNTTLGHTTGPVFAHSARTPIFQIKYNQLEIYRASTESGSYSLVTTVNLMVDQEETTYDDTAGSSTDYYKTRYKNSVASTYSEYSAIVAGTGYTDESLGSITNEILEEFGDPDSKEVLRPRVKNLLKAGVRKIVSEIIKVYPDFRKNYTTQTHTSGTALYDLPTRFLGFFRIDVNYTGSGATTAYKVEVFESESEGQPDTTYYTTDPHVFIRGDQYGLRPTPDSNSGTTFMWYWDYPVVMNEDSDEHGLPYGAREVLVNYVLFRLWLPKDKDVAAIYRQEYRGFLPDYIDTVAQGRQAYRPKYVHATFGDDLYD